MNIVNKKFICLGLAIVLIGGVAYQVLSPSVWERDSLSSIKVGDYDEAIKISKRGLVERPGNRKLQALFLIATALNRAGDGETSWGRETVTEGTSRYLADLNIAGPLGEAKDLWVDGETRQKAVDAAQNELREIRKGFASKGMALENADDLKDIGRVAAKAFLGLKLDVDRQEVQRANLAAYKTLVLLGEKDATKGLLASCESAKDLQQWERIRALKIVGAKNFPAIKATAFDKSQSLYREARLALTLSLWDSEEGFASLANYDQSRLEQPSGSDWDDFATLSDAGTGRHKRMQGGVRNLWATDDNAMVGTTFAWSAPLLKKGGQSGFGVVARVESAEVKIVPFDHFLPIEDPANASLQTDPGTPGEPTRLAVCVARREERGTEYRDVNKYSAWKGSYVAKEPYQTMTSVDYWVLLTYNPSTKRMEHQGYRKGKNPFAADALPASGIPAL